MLEAGIMKIYEKFLDIDDRILSMNCKEEKIVAQHLSVLMKKIGSLLK